MNNEKNKRSEKEITLLAGLKEAERQKNRKKEKKKEGREKGRNKKNKNSDPDLHIISP